MNTDIQIIKKPEWVSWDAIKQCLMDSHAINREKGINMVHYQLPAETIKESLGENGIMLLAMDGNKIVGTAAIVERMGGSWYANGRYGYLCYAGILPEYGGRGIYSALLSKREEIAKDLHYDILLLDTHSDNRSIQEITKKKGYRLVRYFQARSKDHFSVIMVKWLSGCPYSRLYCDLRFLISQIKARIKSIISK